MRVSPFACKRTGERVLNVTLRLVPGPGNPVFFLPPFACPTDVKYYNIFGSKGLFGLFPVK